MRIVSVFALLPLLVIAGCGDGRHSPGFVLGGDGQPRYNNSANVRAETERTIERALNRELAPSWRSNVAIADEPRWSDLREAWLWPATAVRVELSGDAAVPPALDTPTVTAAVVEYFAGRLADAKEQVTVTVTTVARPAAPATPVVAAPVVVAAQAPAEAAPATQPGDAQRYQIQAGDTLARISAVFYGSPKHWRQIVDANPGLVPEALRVGQEIVIPTLAPVTP